MANKVLRILNVSLPLKARGLNKRIEVPHPQKRIMALVERLPGKTVSILFLASFPSFISLAVSRMLASSQSSSLQVIVNLISRTPLPTPPPPLSVPLFLDKGEMVRRNGGRV